MREFSLVLRNTLSCSRPVRIQLIWKKNRDLLAQSIQDSPNGTDSQYRLNSVHCGPIDAASQLTARESYSFIMKMITRKDVPQYTLSYNQQLLFEQLDLFIVTIPSIVHVLIFLDTPGASAGIEPGHEVPLRGQNLGSSKRIRIAN